MSITASERILVWNGFAEAFPDNSFCSSRYQLNQILEQAYFERIEQSSSKIYLSQSNMLQSRTSRRLLACYLLFSPTTAHFHQFLSFWVICFRFLVEYLQFPSIAKPKTNHQRTQKRSGMIILFPEAFHKTIAERLFSSKLCMINIPNPGFYRKWGDRGNSMRSLISGIHTITLQ